MMTFGRCLLLWRLHRGMSQAALAQKARIPQPNLSDMERGERDVSLRTLRGLAQALGVKPGVLADGQGPAETPTAGFSRAQLERIAQAAVDGSTPEDPLESRLARSLRAVTWERRKALMGHSAPSRRGPGRKVYLEWLALSGKYPKPVLNSLLERIAEKSFSGSGK